MSEPLSDFCIYCGSPDVLDDAWYCDKPLCWMSAEKEGKELLAYEARTPLTHEKAHGDLMDTKASVWGTPYLAITHALDKLLASIYINRRSYIGWLFK